MSAGRKLRAVAPDDRPPPRQYDDFVVRVQPTGRWTWGCTDPLHWGELMQGSSRDYVSAAAAQRVLDVHRAIDDADRLNTVCTCRECDVHGKPWVGPEQRKFGEPNPKAYAANPSPVLGTTKETERDE